MQSLPIVAIMVRESTRRRLTEPESEAAPRRPRRAAALVLQRAAHRLDPYVTGSPRVSVGR